MSNKSSRRQFLRGGAALGAFGALSSTPSYLSAIASASAQTSGGYQALVCIYLSGGADALNVIPPYDATNNANYIALRGDITSTTSPGLGYPAGSLIPGPKQGSVQVGFNPNLVNIGKTLYPAGQVAIVPNVGPLAAFPTAPAQVWPTAAVPLPAQLASHIDQQKTWQSLSNTNPDGWGGLLGDDLEGNNPGKLQPFTTVSCNGETILFLSGAKSNQFVGGASGLPKIFFDARPSWRDALIPATQRTNLLEQAVVDVYSQLEANGNTLTPKLPSLSSLTSRASYPGNSNLLAQELTTVARIIAASQASGARSQIFYVNLGSFDTHDAEAKRLTTLLQQLDSAVYYFYDVIANLFGLWNDVALFTMSEFGRQLVPNKDGTDHGWGGHHLVIGGSVAGGVAGGTSLPTIPTPTAFKAGPTQNFIPNGWMIPTTSVEQYGLALAQWMGVTSTASLQAIFPNAYSNGKLIEPPITLFH